jgi:hypothetical protein
MFSDYAPKKNDLSAVAISVFALIFSSLAWWESHQAAKVGRASARANLFVGPANLKSYPSSNPANLDILQVGLTIENSGSSAALHIDVACGASVFQARPAGGKGLAGYPVPLVEHDNTIEALAPHKQVVLSCDDAMPNLPAGHNGDLFVVVLITKLSYVDEASGQVFSSSDSFNTFLVGRKVIRSDMDRGGDTSVFPQILPLFDKMFADSRAKKNP